jgi:PAS domain-containing protein
MVTDNGLRVSGWNPRVEQVFGLAEADALGRHLDVVVPLVDGEWSGVLAGDGAAPPRRGGFAAVARQ